MEQKESKTEMRERHYKQNMEIIKESGVKYELALDGCTMYFKEADRPRVDFFPKRGRWKCGKVIFTGGAKEFLGWYFRAKKRVVFDIEYIEKQLYLIMDMTAVQKTPFRSLEVIRDTAEKTLNAIARQKGE